MFVLFDVFDVTNVAVTLENAGVAYKMRNVAKSSSLLKDIMNKEPENEPITMSTDSKPLIDIKVENNSSSASILPAVYEETQATKKERFKVIPSCSQFRLIFLTTCLGLDGKNGVRGKFSCLQFHLLEFFFFRKSNRAMCWRYLKVLWFVITRSTPVSRLSVAYSIWPS